MTDWQDAHQQIKRLILQFWHENRNLYWEGHNHDHGDKYGPRLGDVTKESSNFTIPCPYCFFKAASFEEWGRLHYQPLFREMSQRSLPKSRLDAWGEPLLISANQKLACTNPSGINYIFWLRRYSLTRPVRNIQDCDNEKCSRCWRMGIVSFSIAWVRKLHWFSRWRQGQNTAFKSIAIAIFSSYFVNVRASKIPQDQLKILLSLLLAKRGSRWGRLRAKAAEDFVDNSPVEFKLTSII